jgi:hypothetical protein
MSSVEFDPCSADDVLGVLANAHLQHTHELDAMLAAGLPIAAAGLIYTGWTTGKSQRSAIIIRMCQERVDAGADPAPIGIALSLLLVPGLLALAPDASPLRRWFCPPTTWVSDGADSLRGLACQEAAAATARGSGALQPAGGDELAWIVCCCTGADGSSIDADGSSINDIGGTDTRQSSTKFAERVMAGLERGELDPEIALAAVLQRINLLGDGLGIDLPDMADAIATGFTRMRTRAGWLPPVIV